MPNVKQLYLSVHLLKLNMFVFKRFSVVQVTGIAIPIRHVSWLGAPYSGITAEVKIPYSQLPIIDGRTAQIVGSSVSLSETHCLLLE